MGIATIKKTMCGKRNTFILLVRMQASEATMEISMEASIKLNLELPFYPDIALLGINSKDCISCHKYICTYMFTVALFFIPRPRCPSTDEWIMKMWCLHTKGF